jgi:hypothetical protein
VTTADFVDLAAMLALQTRDANGRPVVLRSLAHSLRAVETLSGLWNLALDGTSFQPTMDGPASPERVAAVEEMLTAEMLLRVWCAYLSGGIEEVPGRYRPARVSAAIASAILHQRRRTLLALLHDQSLKDEQYQLDRTRRRVERWTDVLLAAFPVTPATALLHFDRDRSQDFADVWPAQAWGQTSQAEPLIISSLRASMPVVNVSCEERAAAYSVLLKSILNCLGENAFDGRGQRQTWRRRRVESGWHDTDRLPAFWKPTRPANRSEPPQLHDTSGETGT